MKKPDLITADNPLEVILKQRVSSIYPVKHPLALISQIQRSGGTLLVQLFDGHPQLHVHHSELHIGHPNKYYWPDLDLNESPEDWFELLAEHIVLRHTQNGYNKASNPQYKNDTLPFVFLYDLQKAVFLKSVEENDIATQRDILDCYITSYFNAWLDYQGSYRPPGGIKFWTAFVARLSMNPDNCELFFRDYPDGRLISIIREPVSWYASARNHVHDVYNDVRYKDINEGIKLWKESTLSIIRNKQKYGDKVHIIDFAGLIENTEETIMKVTEFLGIKWYDKLLFPTFNSMPIRANTSFEVNSYGIIKEPLKRFKDVNTNEREYIETETVQLYKEVKKIISSK